MKWATILIMVGVSPPVELRPLVSQSCAATESARARSSRAMSGRGAERDGWHGMVAAQLMAGCPDGARLILAAGIRALRWPPPPRAGDGNRSAAPVGSVLVRWSGLGATNMGRSSARALRASYGFPGASR